jgi:hypothetical protein
MERCIGTSFYLFGGECFHCWGVRK